MIQPVEVGLFCKHGFHSLCATHKSHQFTIQQLQLFLHMVPKNYNQFQINIISIHFPFLSH